MMRMIAAIDRRRGLATDEGIPWTLPTDQRFFVEQTREGLILMGLGTYQEFDEPMHDRTNYVATRGTDRLRPRFVPVPDVPAFVTAHSGETIQNIGGGVLFTSTLHLADELVLTRIDGDFACTKFFPDFEAAFRRTSQSDPVTENGTSFRFETWRPSADPSA